MGGGFSAPRCCPEYPDGHDPCDDAQHGIGVPIEVRCENRSHDARDEEPAHPAEKADWVGCRDEHRDSREDGHENQEPDTVNLPERGVGRTVDASGASGQDQKDEEQGNQSEHLLSPPLAECQEIF